MLWLNIATAVFGLGATLAAFGGDTWSKGSAPILKRITLRGWLALACILLAFAFGITKEVIQNRHAEGTAAAQAELQQQNQLQRERIEQQVTEISDLQERLREEVKKSTETILSEAEKRRLVIEPTFENGIYSLVNKHGGAVKNLDFEIYAVIYAEIIRGDASLLPGGIMIIPSPSPGVLYDVNKGQHLFSINTNHIYDIVRRTIEEVKNRIPNLNTVELNQFTCVRMTYDDEYGGSYQNFLSLRVFHDVRPRFQDMHDHKFLYSHCQDDYDTYKEYSANFLEKWHEDDRNLLVDKIVASAR